MLKTLIVIALYALLIYVFVLVVSPAFHFSADAVNAVATSF